MTRARSTRSKQRMQDALRADPGDSALLTLPGVGLTLAVVIALEVGDIGRFASAEKLAALCRHDPARPRQRREDPLRAGPPGRQPLPQVGVRRSGERDLPARGGVGRAVTSAGSMSGSPDARGTRKPSGRWPGIWPKRRTGS